MNAKLTAEALEYLKLHATQMVHEGGAVICDRAEKPDLHIILEGDVEVRMPGPDGTYLALNHIGAGGTFGEIAILQKRKGSSQVVATGQVTTLTYPASRFQQAMDECTPFRTYVVERLAESIQETRTEAWGFFQRAQALNLLMSSRPKAGPLIARSSIMKDLEAKLPTLANETTSLLITGDAGTGKYYFATKIHELASEKDPSHPFTVVDCRKVRPENIAKLIFGSSQYSFGSTHVSHFGALHLCDGGILIIRHIELLPPDAQSLISQYIREKPAFPKTRIIGTAGVDLIEAAAQGRFNPILAEILLENQIRIPTLSERRKDMLKLIHQFLSERGDNKVLSRLAAAVVFSNRYKVRNAIELRECLETAATFAPGKEILPEHVVSGIKNEETLLQVDLTAVPWIRWMIRLPVMRTIRATMWLSFSGLIALLLFAPLTAAGIFANRIIWGFWEPCLIFYFLFTGRLWCTTCPLTAAGFITDFLARLLPRKAQTKPEAPLWLQKYSIHFMMLLIGLIFWSEHLFKMHSHPFATGVLLSTLLALPVIMTLLYQRQSWCQHLCPLGALGGAYSSSSSLEVKADSGLCATYCKTHDCFRGNATSEGCPVFHHPLQTQNNHTCTLCFRCIRICPHNSVKFYARPFLQSIWNQGLINTAFSPFCLSVFFLSIVNLLGNTEDSWFQAPEIFTAGVIASLGLALLLAKKLPRLFDTETLKDTSLPARISFALALLGWGPLMAFQIENIPFLDHFRIHLSPGTLLDLLSPTLLQGEIAFRSLLQVFCLVVAFLFTGLTLFLIRRRLIQIGAARRRFHWNVLYLLCFIYIGISFWIVGSRSFIPL